MCNTPLYSFLPIFLLSEVSCNPEHVGLQTSGVWSSTMSARHVQSPALGGGGHEPRATTPRTGPGTNQSERVMRYVIAIDVGIKKNLGLCVFDFTTAKFVYWDNVSLVPNGRYLPCNNVQYVRDFITRHQPYDLPNPYWNLGSPPTNLPRRGRGPSTDLADLRAQISSISNPPSVN